MQLNENAIDLLKKRYFSKELNETTWEQLSKRIALSIADAEETETQKKYWQDKFYDLIYNLKFIPSTPCLINANKENPGQLSSCFIIELRDSIESIYSANSQCAKIFQKNGGVGFDISVLRPRNSVVETSKGYTIGPVGFMEIFDLTAKKVTENNIRKGAIKIDLGVFHPDIYEFIHCKDDITKLNNMNISVGINDAFMRAVENDEMWQLRFPDFSWNKEIYNKEWDGDIEEWESKGYPVVVYKEIKAKDLYKEIMESAWRTGEPGISFVDTMNRANPNPHLGKVRSTNPCSEFSSIPHNSCNLGSINLANCGDTEHEVINEVRERVKVSVRFLDNMITVNKLPLEKIENVTKTVRSIGLGVMGFADMLYNLNIRYNSQEAYDFTRKLFKAIRDTALETSIALAEEKGVYDAWPNSIWAKKGIKVRNSNFLSIAPTGSISFIAGTSGGIEPNYALVYTRRTNEDDLYYITNPIFKKVLEDRDLYSDELLEKIVNNNGSCQGIPEIPEDIQKVFVTAYDITPKEHIDMVSIIQNYVDLSISKTVNLSEEATVDDIMDLYAYSWKQGLKGVTVYRNNCRKNQVLSVGKVEKPKPKITEAGYVDVEPAMKVAYGKRIKVKTGCGALWLFFFVNEKGELAEIWSQVSGGGCKANIESISRLTSLAFRAKIDPKLILDQLSSAFCKNSMDKVGSKSCAHIIAREIEKFLRENQTIIAVPREKVDNKQSVIDEVRNPCPDCGSQLTSTEGCIKCDNCGYSKC